MQSPTYTTAPEPDPAVVNRPPARWSARPFTFYYLRITQTDGEAAWASPVWIES